MTLTMLRHISKGVPSVRRRKRTNGCLLSLLKMMVVGSFVVLMSFFGMYKLTTSIDSVKPREQASPDNETRALVQVQSHAVKVEHKSVEEEVAPKEEITIKEEVPIVEQVTRVQTTEEAGQTQEVAVPPNDEIIIEIPKEVVTHIEEHTLEEVVKEQVEEEQTMDSKVDIPVYNRYELNLDEGVLQEAENIIKDGQINVTNVVGQYFASMSMQEKLSLINMLVSKIKNIDIGYIWGIVADGITLEETLLLQQLIEDNFTEDEIDELYMYYEKSELAQLP